MLHGNALREELNKATNRPIWHFCPYALSEKCPGTCSYDDQPGFRCSHLTFAEINARDFLEGKKLSFAAPYLKKEA